MTEETKQEENQAPNQITDSEFIPFKQSLKHSAIKMLNNSMIMFVLIKIFESGDEKDKLDIKDFINKLSNDMKHVHKQQSLLSFTFTEEQEAEIDRILNTSVTGTLMYINQAIKQFDEEKESDEYDRKHKEG